MLTAFYQQKDPSKLASIDKFLTKYAGQEDQLFRNLAKKYNIDPSMFGVSAAAPAPAAGRFGAATSPGGFGQQSTLGGGSLFGSPPATAPSAGGFGQASAVGGSAPAFGTAAGGSGFGSLAQSGGGGGFGAAAAPAAGGFGGFGSPAPAPGAFGSPFGAARR